MKSISFLLVPLQGKTNSISFSGAPAQENENELFSGATTSHIKQSSEQGRVGVVLVPFCWESFWTVLVIVLGSLWAPVWGPCGGGLDTVLASF